MKTTPLVSILMPSYNQAEFIENSIRSVLEQKYTAIELIVADGQSSDDTIEILKRLSEQFDNLYWTSEKDTGPANAVNRALAKARGTIIGWLNSDDLFTPGAIARAANAFQANPNWIMVYGHGEHIGHAGEAIGPYPTLPPDQGINAFSSSCFICQPSAFFKASMPLLLGPLDETYQASFDFDYWVRAFMAFPERIGFIDSIQAQSRLHDDCITERMRQTIAIEGLKVTHTHLGRAQIHWLVTYFEDIHARPPEERPFSSFKDHARETLNLAQHYLSVDDITALKHSLGLTE